MISYITATIVITCSNAGIPKYFHPDNTLYNSDNVAMNNQTKKLFATKDISQGTVLIVEKSWMDNSVIPSISDMRLHITNLYHTDDYFKYYVDQFVDQSIKNVSFPSAALSWDNGLYSSIPLIKTGLQSNTFVFQNSARDNLEKNDTRDIILIMSTTSIQKGEYLKQSISFFKNLIKSPFFGLYYWQQSRVNCILSKQDRNVFKAYWSSFEAIHNALTNRNRFDAQNIFKLFQKPYSDHFALLLRIFYRDGYFVNEIEDDLLEAARSESGMGKGLVDFIKYEMKLQYRKLDKTKAIMDKYRLCSKLAANIFRVFDGSYSPRDILTKIPRRVRLADIAFYQWLKDSINVTSSTSAKRQRID